MEVLEIGLKMWREIGIERNWKRFMGRYKERRVYQEMHVHKNTKR